MHSQIEQSFDQEARHVAALKSPGGDTDSIMGLSKIDASKFDMGDFMGKQETYVYIVSGYMENTLFATERLDINRGIWEKRSDVNIARTKFGVVQHNDTIYAMGGKL